MKNKLVVALVTLALSQASIGGEIENDLIDKVVAAYGGDRISKLQSFTITKKFLSPTLGQSHTSELEHVGSITQHIAVDKQSGRALFESLFSGRSGDFQNATVTDGEVAHAINYQAGTFGVAAQVDIYAFGGGSMRTSDAVLAHELAHEWMHDEAQRKDTSKTVRETEAEAVAYAVCRAFNLDCSTRSSDYIQLYQGDSDVLGRSLARIQLTVARMIDSLKKVKQEEVAA